MLGCIAARVPRESRWKSASELDRNGGRQLAAWRPRRLGAQNNWYVTRRIGREAIVVDSDELMCTPSVEFATRRPNESDPLS